MNLLYFLMALMALFQATNGKISVTLLDDNMSPVTQETIEFKTESEQFFASCVTSSNGHCVITLDNAPTDPSGLIRGTLAIKGRGLRPVIWPGGPITIQLLLDRRFKLTVPSDLYVTRTPKVTETSLAGVPEVVQTTTITFASPIALHTPIIAATSTPKIAVTSTPLDEDEVVPAEANYWVWFQIALLIILMAAAIVYISATKGAETS